MPSTVYGLPVHVLIVHATVVLVPLTALVLFLSVVSARFRSWAGWLPLGLAVLSVVLAPLSTSSGENLEHRVGESRLVEAHAHLGDQLIWFCLGMLVVAAAATFVRRRRDASRAMAAGLLVLGVLATGATMVQVVRIGHSGAKAAWSDVMSSSTQSAQGQSTRDDG